MRRSEAHAGSISAGAQRGAVLAACLALLLITTLLATAGIREATLELAKTGSRQAVALAFAAAETGLSLTLAAGGFEHTAPRDLPPAILANGTSWLARVRFVGVADPPPGAGVGPDTGTGPVNEPAPAAAPDDRAWHFLITVEGRGPMGAVARIRQQVYVLGGAGFEPGPCLSDGCPVPLRCEGPCTLPARAEPLRVAWHEMERP